MKSSALAWIPDRCGDCRVRDDTKAYLGWITGIAMPGIERRLAISARAAVSLVRPPICTMNAP